MNEHIERFNTAARQYTTDRYPGRARCMEKVLDLLSPQGADVVLDVGCGPGAQLIRLSPLIRSGIGIDPAERMIAQAVRAADDCPNLRFHVGTAEALPQEIDHAGVKKIFSNYALHHLPGEAKRRCIENFASLLPAGGIVVLGDLMFSDDPDNHEALFDVVGYGPGCDTPSRLPEIEAMFAGAGLTFRTHVLNPLVAVVVGRKA
jgi:SAM-dependent methyltransferase